MKKMIVVSSSDDEDDGELALMMRKFTRLSDKINKKGYNFDPKRRMFRPREYVKNKTYYNCGEKGHISLDSSERRTTRASIAMIQAMMMKMKRRTRSLGRRRAMIRKPSSSQRRKATPREASWWKNKNG